MTTAAKVTTREVMEALRKKFAGKSEAEWAGGFYLEECGLNGGGPVNSRCDALYAGFTSASGRTLIGHEVKVSRSDWLAELKKVGKADFWFDNTHQWYLVAPAGVVNPEEIPHEWGYLEYQGSRLVIKVKAPFRDVTPSWTALRSILSRAETLRAESVRRALQDAHQTVSQQVRELQSQLHAAEQSGGLGRGPQAERWRHIIATAESRIRELGHHGPVPEETVIRALVDAATVQAAADQLRIQLEGTIRQANAALSGIRGSYGPLRKIVEGMA